MDLFCGSGTMHVAALAAGRNVISIDINQIAVETTKARYTSLVDKVRTEEKLDISKI